MSLTRRSMLQALAAPLIMRGQGPDRARVYLDPDRTVSTLDRNVFGSFLEHLGRAIYEGIYDPRSPFADKNGFRKDVLKEIKEMQVPIIRYPGGNFVSGYNWLDGVGPRDKRPRVLERAWNSIETNQFGTNEFLQWCKLVGSEPLLAVNLGNGTPQSAADLVEYCNADKGTKYANLRVEHGYPQPYNVRYWCLGNEMDGPWQIGHMPAREYGLKAADAARQMRTVDKNLKLIAAGSSSASMPTFLEWDRTMLEECYTLVDGVSLHRYFGDRYEGKEDPLRYLAENLTFENQIDEVAAAADYVGGKLKLRKRLFLSFDEWNVWYRARGGDGKRQEAPHILEEEYNLEDALLVGGLLNSLIRRSDRVKIACLAQLVNVIAPIMTDAKSVLQQTIYYPYAWALAHARGSALDVKTDSAAYDSVVFGREVQPVPYVDGAATIENKNATVFLLNRDTRREREVELIWRGASIAKVIGAETLTGTDLKASNTFAAPKRVGPRPLDLPRAGAQMTVKLPAQSYSMLRLQLA